MQEEDEKSRANVNTNSYAVPIEPNVVNTEYTEKHHSSTFGRSDGSVRQIQSLRDTGTMQSLLKDTHNSEDYIMTNKTTLLKGITTKSATSTSTYTYRVY